MIYYYVNNKYIVQRKLVSEKFKFFNLMTHDFLSIN